MTQPLSFDFDALPPYSGRSQATRHTSRSGAIAAAPRAQSQLARMLVRYLDYGALSDGDQAFALGLPEGRISARRSTAIQHGLVAYVDIVQGVHGAKVTRWGLTVKGLHVAAKVAAI